MNGVANSSVVPPYPIWRIAKQSGNCCKDRIAKLGQAAINDFMSLNCCLRGATRILSRPGLFRLFALACMFWITTASALVDEAPPAPDIEVLRADFGLFNPAPSGEWVLTPSAVVPLKQGQHYGWSIVLRTARPWVKWREEFTLPAPPSNWASGELPAEDQTISSDRTTSILELDAVPVNGVIENIWEVAPGDPKGHYTIRVTIDGGNQQVFEFDVQE
ncbi:MAG TPA: hypothetical protein VEP67_12690 [Thiobacillaceae bacterium]|nr:hypothetical protein [Thiobacillaceae bacterium]